MKHVKHSRYVASLLLLLTWALALNPIKTFGQESEEAPSLTLPISVVTAYRSIPHPNTPFNAEISKLKPAEKAYLAQLFRLTDEALVFRVSALQWFLTDGRIGIETSVYEQAMTKILSQLTRLDVPRRLIGVHQLIYGALLDQMAYLVNWQQHIDIQHRLNPKAKLVVTSHKKLRKAYEYLNQFYPREAPYNRQAFHDHLFALSFIDS